VQRPAVGVSTLRNPWAIEPIYILVYFMICSTHKASIGFRKKLAKI